MIYKVPNNISDEYAAMVEILSIGFHASARAGLEKNDDILIVGSGKVGQSILHAARTITSGNIILADILDERLNIAKSASPDIHTINIKSNDPVFAVKEFTGGKGFELLEREPGKHLKILLKISLLNGENMKI